MAFEAFRAQAESRRPSARRRLVYSLSLAVHGGLIAFGVLYSFWHIEELSPPTLKVTFLAVAPPPPPPPPPAGGGGPARKKPASKPHPVVPTRTPEIVQPRETPKPEDEPKPEPKETGGEKDGVKGGTVGGVAGGTLGGVVGGKLGGVVGGTAGGTGVAPRATFLPPFIGSGLKLSGDKPEFPPALRRAGASFRLLAKICVSITGTVDKVTIGGGADPLLADSVVTKVKTWRYRPYTANGAPIPYCYPATFEFNLQ